MKRFGVLFLFSTALVVGQQVRFSAPVLGYVYDPGARAIRSISGVPGAAGFGHELATDLDRTFVSPAGDYALSNGLRLLRWSGREISQASLDSAGTQPDDIAFSPSGEVAAIYYKDSGTIEVWAGLPDFPKLAFRHGTQNVLRVFAVSDDASAVVGAGQNCLVLIAPEGERMIANGEFAAAAFVGGSLDAVAAESTGDQVLMFRNLALASVVAGPGEGVAGPLALGISADNGKLFVANGRSESLLQIDLETSHVSKIACECKPDVMQRLRGNATFRITGTFKTRIFLVDADAAEPRVFVIPGGAQ